MPCSGECMRPSSEGERLWSLMPAPAFPTQPLQHGQVLGICQASDPISIRYLSAAPRRG